MKEDNGWRYGKYGNRYNIYWTKKDYMNAKIKSKMKKENIKIEDGTHDTLGYVQGIKSLKVNDLPVGQLYYNFENNQPRIEHIVVHPDYRRKGYATMLLKDFQKQVGDQDIDFGFATKEYGVPLLEKTAIIKEEKEDKYGGKHFKGRIKL